MASIAHAVELVRRGSVAEAEALVRALLATPDPRTHPPAACLALLAEIQLSTGRTAEAIEVLTALSRLLPHDAATLRRLGGALLTAGRASDAIAALERAIDLDPENVRAHNNLGQAFLHIAEVPRAITQFERAVALDPNYAIGHTNLGLAWSRAGDADRAIFALRRAIDIDAGSVDAWMAHGALLLALNRAAAALASFDAVLRLRPGDAAALKRKASALLRLERPADALRMADCALAGCPDDAEALDVKAAALSRLNRPVDARRTLETAVALRPDFVEAWCDLAVVHQHLGDDAAAARSLRQALTVDAGSAHARAALIAAQIPSIPAAETESTAARCAFEHELGAFEGWLTECELSDADAWTLARQPFFYLSYQEFSNRPLLERYRRATAARMARIDGSQPATDILSPAVPRAEVHAVADAKRVKVGFVSAQIYDHSVFNAIVRGWLHGLDRTRFETSLFYLGNKQDAATAFAASAVDHFESGPCTPAEWAGYIASQHLDALIFPEIGIDRDTLALAHLRLARRQFAAWGHPETSGLPTIDAFLSAEAFEPVQAQFHYSEHLIRLPGLGVYYEPYTDEPAPVDLAQWGISDGVPLLICPGSPFKYHPAHDAVWVEIARRLGGCTFVFFQHERAELSDKLGRRLIAAFTAAGLDAGRHLKFLPWLPRAAFLGLLRRADVYLDTLGFSGFNTFMQAVQAQLPGVALEGQFMRGRLGSGILRHLGLSELVAATPAEYVALAVKLAADPSYRGRMRDALREREAGAYGDATVIDALSTVLLSR